MQITITARNKNNMDGNYDCLKKEGLQAKIEKIAGEGSLENPWRVPIKIINKAEKAWMGVIQIAYELLLKHPRFFLPGFMYGSNRGEAPLDGKNEFPRLRAGDKNKPASPWWMVRSDRLSHPVALVYEQGRLYGLSASPYFILKNQQKTAWKPGEMGEFCQYSGFMCSMEQGSIGYTLGYENAPWHFIESHDVRERMPLSDNCFYLSSGEEVTFEIYLYDFEVEDERSVYQTVQAVYEQYHEAPRKASGLKDTVSDLVLAVSEDAWLSKEHNYSGFVFENPDGSLHYHKLSSISWTNGLAVAVPALLSGLRLQNEKIREQALECIDHIVQNSMNPASGLPYESCNDGIWSNQGWWYDRMHTPGHASYLIGQALFYILKAYDYEKRLINCEHSDWMEFAKKVIYKVEQTKNTDHEYPYIFSNTTGAGLEYDSMAGAWCMAASAYYCLLEKDFTYLEGLKQSEKHYYDTFIKKAECYGGPLDTDKAVDSEGVLAYIRACRLLHLITVEERYLEHLKDAICYEFTFKFCYNSPVKTPPLSNVGWSSCGGSITSVANPHIHPMSSTVTDELLYYIRHKSNPYIESRLKDTILWSCQTYNRFEKEYDYGRKGWMSERFCYSEGLLKEKYPDGSAASTWFALMPWASGCILEGLSGECWGITI